MPYPPSGPQPRSVNMQAELHGGPVEDHATVPMPVAPVAIDRGALPMAEVVGRVAKIQNVMSTLMKPDVHYGTIPGTPKPTLYQPGAELLCMTFRIAPTPRVEDLSTSDEVRYRVTVAGVNQVTGEQLGEGVGECSSSEEKYRWRRPVCDEEWNETPEDRRREKWMRGRSGNYKAKQVRTSPPDVANTILKMAYKRALISMTRVTLACSDIFAQDLEDLPEEIRESVLAEEHPVQSKKEPQSKSARAPQKPQGAESSNPQSTATEGTTGPVKVSKGESKRDRNDKEYFLFHASDGKAYSTRDEKTAMEVESFIDTPNTIRIRYRAKTIGGREYRDILSFAADEAPAAPDDDLTADDIGF